MNRKLHFSLALSCLSIVTTTWINVSIASHYLSAHGKTQALFGIIELTYWFQYFVSVIGLAALILSVSSRNRSGFRLFCIALSIVALVLVFVRLWKLFILLSAPP